MKTNIKDETKIGCEIKNGREDDFKDNSNLLISEPKFWAVYSTFGTDEVNAIHDGGDGLVCCEWHS